MTTPLVDLQVNGFSGNDFSSPDLTIDQVIQITDQLSEVGTTAYLATMITSPMEVYRHNLPILAKAASDSRLKGRLLGVHLEGPFLNSGEGARGAHNPEWMSPGDTKRLQELIDLGGGTVRLVTIAADIDGAETVTGVARENKIAVSMGHHLADGEQIARLRAAGATVITHLGNGLPRMIDRHNNPLWPAMADDGLTAMIITDGHHLPPDLIRVIVRAKTAARIVVTSDCSPLAGMPPGRYHSLGNDCVLDPSGRLYNPATGYLVGSSATMKQCMDHLASLNILSDDELRQVGYENPLRLIGRDTEIKSNIKDQNAK
ncbi:MAG: N-acetylglucosamine-6-phosphate deacetylase [Phycisphaerae bacterium]|nr:N-acetylglucosamine-6-phosphate deacetylase [Phycisphaerae bacterium]